MCIRDSFLSQYLRDNSEIENLVIVVGMLKRKNYKEILTKFLKDIGECFEGRVSFVVTKVESERAISCGELAEVLVTAVEVGEPRESIEFAIEKSDENSLIVVFGSVYLVGEVRPIVSDGVFETIVHSNLKPN